MGYDGFLGYIDENEPVPDNIRGCIDSFLALPKVEQNIYFAMYDKGMDYAEKADEFGKIHTYSLADWVKTALKYINGFSNEDCTNYALNKSVENTRSTKIIEEKDLTDEIKEMSNKFADEINKTIEDIKDAKKTATIAIPEGFVIPNTITKTNTPADFNNEKSSHISWDEFFMGVAELAAKRSKDPSTQVGACIVKDKHIISTGYNGMPYCESIDNDEAYPWTREGEDQSKTKYFYVVHAEENAILSSPVSVRGATLYCTLFPCNECAKAIIQSGIKELIYKEYRDEKIFNTALLMMSNAGIRMRKYL